MQMDKGTNLANAPHIVASGSNWDPSNQGTSTPPDSTLRFGVLLPQHVCDKLMNNVALVLEVLVLAKTFSYNGESCQKGQG